MNAWMENSSNAMPLEDKRPIVSPTHDYPVRTTFIDMGGSEVKKRKCRFGKNPPCDVEDDRTFADRFRDFGRNTTFHGLGYVTNNKYNYIRRLLWSLVVLCAIGLLLTKIVTLTIHFYTFPMTSTISINYVSNMTFPAVTLCNFNQFKKSSFNQKDLELFNMIYGPERNVDSIDFGAVSDFSVELKDQDQVEQFMASSSHTLDDMLIDCKWKSSHPCTTSNFTRRLTDHGICFTFNEPANKAERPLDVRNAGSRDGLYMRLYAEHDEYTFGESTAAGFRVLLHPQGVLPLVKELGFSLSPGFESSVTVRQNNIKTLEAPFKSNCTMDSKTTLSGVYTVPTCRFKCKIKFVVEECGCRDYRWPGKDPICGPEQQVKCVYPKEEEFQESDVACECPDSCNITTYENRISMGYWPADHITAFHTATKNISVSYIRKNYLDVYIFFEELMYIQIEQQEAYSKSSLQSDIGGYMGLLCGMSAITVMEWIDFLTVTLLRKFRLRKD